MLIANLAAFGAAIAWSIGSLISIEPARKLGAFSFTRLRMTIVFIILAIVTTFLSGWQSIKIEDLWILAISGFIGISLGDTALFAGLRRIGPRRNSILFATNAPISAILAYYFLDEILGVGVLIGCGMVLTGVILSIIFGKRRDQIHQWEKIDGNLLLGIGFGLMAGFCQAAGAIIAKPALENGADPIAVSTIRVGIGAFCLILATLVPDKKTKTKVKMNKNLFGRVALSGVIGMGLGMTLLLFALARENAGIVMTLSSTMPVIILPFIWVITRERPAIGAFIGATITIIGTGLIFLL